MREGEFKFHALCDLENKCRYNGRCKQCRTKGKVSRKKLCWACILKNYRAEAIETANR
jgi:hypothetical protein